ncbi:MAG TPA: hypothetical protein EYQ86_09680, partial [Bacteroidetes bacterium]|nr:hypothetical protein [Bacteroidota bacterium]
MILIGYSSYFMVVIRSTANPAIDMNNPEDPFNLLSYLQREQYGSAPVFYGQYYPAQQVEKEEVSSKYYQDINKDGEDEYFFKSKRYQAVYEEEFCGVFPRMWSPQKNHIRTYRNIAKPTYEVRDRASQRRVASFKSLKQANEYVKKSDNPYLRVVDKFTFADNLRFFSVYQVGWMYVRYFLWNFGGRQNDMQGHMGTVNGNWQSGIDFIDEARGIIPNKYLPQDLRENKAYNPFYLLPFILGLIGLFYHFNTRKDDAFVVFLLWFFTGIAILIFLNQYPYQPRERDYAFAGSVYAFCIWIGIGTLGIYELFNRYLRSKQITSVVSVTLCFMAVPFLMGFHG